jgi:DNA polymerase kappa
LGFEVEKIEKFIGELPVRKVPGVGKINEHILAGLGIVYCRDVVHIEKASEIYINFTENAFDFLIKACHGLAKDTHEVNVSIKKSINISESIPLTSDYEAIKSKVEKLCQELEGRMELQKMSGKTLSIEFKNDKFKNKQKQYTQTYYMTT